MDVPALVAGLLADPPQVHQLWDSTGNEVGCSIWPTDAACYEFIARSCRPASRTLETGLGVSTALFALLSTDHTCVTWSNDEVDRLQAYCTERGISTAGIRFHVGHSERVLPALDPDELDLVFIDGSHGFPAPIIDWFYAGGRLRKGGILILDDNHLPAVRVLSGYLDRDGRWRRLRGTDKWLAYERLSEGTLSEDWWAQPKSFGLDPATTRGGVVPRLLRRAARLARKSGSSISARKR
jgi:predicted O-methyltransferase YrrM